MGIPEGAWVVGSVGRLVEVKRYDLLLRAFAAVQKKHSDACLLLVGDGVERQNLERLAAELRLQDKVIFAGYQSQPERFFSAMDVFAMSSRHEGLPLALLEAWAAGLPVVAPAVGGIAKTVTDGQNGLLFPKEDEAALAAGLERLLTDREGAGRLAAAGQELVRRKYSLERMADEYERRYRELIAAA